VARYTKIKTEVHAEKAILRLREMKKRGKDFTPVFEEAKVAMRAWNAANFAQNGLPSGSLWNALDAGYGSWKMTHFPGVPPMVRTGRLFRSLSSLQGPPNVIEPLSAEFGTAVEYAKFHQYGTTKMAKRKVVFEPPLFARRLANAAAAHQANGKFSSSSMMVN